MNEEQVREIIRDELGALIANDRYVFQRELEIANARNIILGESVGTKIGTSTTQKLGFYGVTPVVQPSSTAIVTGTANGTYDTTEQDMINDLVTAVNSIISDLRTLGLQDTA